jgi:hypothetical protein
MLTTHEPDSPVTEGLNERPCDAGCRDHQGSSGYDLAPGNAHIAERRTSAAPRHWRATCTEDDIAGSGCMCWLGHCLFGSTSPKVVDTKCVKKKNESHRGHLPPREVSVEQVVLLLVRSLCGWGRMLIPGSMRFHSFADPVWLLDDSPVGGDPRPSEPKKLKKQNKEDGQQFERPLVYIEQSRSPAE